MDNIKNNNKELETVIKSDLQEANKNEKNISKIRVVFVNDKTQILGGPYASVVDLINAHVGYFDGGAKELVWSTGINEGTLSSIRHGRFTCSKKVAEKYFKIGKDELISNEIYYNHGEHRTMSQVELAAYINSSYQYTEDINNSNITAHELNDQIEEAIEFSQRLNENVERVLTANEKEKEKLKQLIIEDKEKLEACWHKFSKYLEIINSNISGAYNKLDSVITSIEDTNSRIEKVEENISKTDYSVINSKLQMIGFTNSTKIDRLNSLIERVDQLSQQIRTTSLMVSKGVPESSVLNISRKRSKVEQGIDEIIIVLSLALVFILFNGGGDVLAFMLIYIFLMLSFGIYFMIKKCRLRCESTDS